MLIKSKKIVSFLMVFSLLLAFVPEAFAASSQNQIVANGITRYYNSTGGEVMSAPSLGDNAVVSVAKTIKATDVENEFEMTLDVKTSVDIREVNVSADAAVVLVLDLSNSMAGTGASDGSSGGYIPALRTAAQNFVKSFADANDAVRYISLVTFATNGEILYGWTDINDTTNRNNIVNKIGTLTTQGSTNMESGLQLARNLLREQAFPKGKDGNPIENRSVIVFSDGAANHLTTTAGRNVVGYTAGTKVPGTGTQLGESDNRGMVAAAEVAQVVKNSLSFYTSPTTYNKHDAYMFTIAFGSQAPATWLGNNIATNTSFAYSASNANDLNKVFAAIAQRIESWAEAWVVTDPMGANIEFISNISPNDTSTGLLKFENNTLSWNLKKAFPLSDGNNIFTYTHTYRIRLDTTSSSYIPYTSYPTNGKTELTYVMVTEGKISSDIMIATFSVPAVKGYGPGSFGFTKVGDNKENLAGCVFNLANQTAGKAGNVFTGTSAIGTGAVSFSNLPSGHTYKLTETSMPSVYNGTYRKSNEVYTVTVSLGEVIIKDGKGNVVGNGFKFNNPAHGRKVTGLVWPLVTYDLELGDEFLRKHDIVVELRATFLTPAPAELSTTAVWTGTGDFGRFTFDDVVIGDYLLYIKRPGFLTRCMPVTVSPSDSEVIELTPPGSATVFDLWWGDVNDDLIIDNLDIMMILESMSLNIDALNPDYNPAHDLNADGLIDNLDIMVVIESLGKDILQYPGAESVDPWE